MDLTIDGQPNLTCNNTYTPGLDPTEEAVISSHFMHTLVANDDLGLYDDDERRARTLVLDTKIVSEHLLPELLRQANAFAADRARAADGRARLAYQEYGLTSSDQVGVAQIITEVMFDRQFLRTPRRTCSRRQVCVGVSDRIASGAVIDLVIPALPLKFWSPLKTRGRLPDLSEVNFILELYEIVRAIEHIYREAAPDRPGPLARFTVVSDGSRFSRVINEPDFVIEAYQAASLRWIDRLGLASYVRLLDYRRLLRDRLPASLLAEKAAIFRQARDEYAGALNPVFDPGRIGTSLVAAARVEPDPEVGSPDGRFVPLLMSLIHTLRYGALQPFESLPALQYQRLYRDLTGHLLEPFAGQATDGHEYLRQAMLREAWNAAIDYIAEIKSDRDLKHDPILLCLPDHIRWTIHAKPGQLAVSTQTANGIAVQAWAGTAVFRPSSKNRIKLSTLPLLALEGAGATPVVVTGDDTIPDSQPFFYLHHCLDIAGGRDLVSRLSRSLTRRRSA
jgi:hypothetical protein